AATTVTLHTISEAEIQDISSSVTSRVVTEMVAQLQDRLGELKSTTLDIAVTGESDPAAAKTGVTEATRGTIPYVNPDMPTVRLWDLPGTGTPDFQPKTYLEAIGLYQFDFFIIVASERFRESHVTLAQCIGQAGKKFDFVRSKVNNNLEATIRDERGAALRRSDVQQPRMFLMSCFQPHLFGFPLLHTTLESELEGHKRHVLLLALPNLTSTVLEKKKQAFHGSVWRTVMTACLGAMRPVSAASGTVPWLMDTLRSYQQSFGIDTNSLHRLASLTGESYQSVPSSSSQLSKGQIIISQVLRKGEEETKEKMRAEVQGTLWPGIS
uniref:IRG-type G domain-containing protein n=1 Tax=Paramormyrops kingsleyae TaxID=1676925 RepID=A0A3B3SPR5_9TELE